MRQAPIQAACDLLAPVCNDQWFADLKAAVEDVRSGVNSRGFYRTGDTRPKAVIQTHELPSPIAAIWSALPGHTGLMHCVCKDPAASGRFRLRIQLVDATPNL